MKWFTLGLAAVMLAGCSVISDLSTGEQIVGSGKVTTLTKQVGSFKSVDLDGSMDVNVTIGPASAIKVEGDDNIIPHVKLEVRGGSLHVGMEKGSYTMNHGLKVSFSVPTLNAAAVNGSGNLVVHGLKGGDFTAEINGSGNVTASGTAKDLKGLVAGSGDLALYDLKAGDADVSITGSGGAHVNVSGVLAASITGSGEIRYRGKPSQVKKSVTGSGDIGPQE